MKIHDTVRAIATRLRCRRCHRAMVADLETFSDWQLQDIGLWRGAIPAAAAGMLASQNCEPPVDQAG